MFYIQFEIFKDGKHYFSENFEVSVIWEAYKYQKLLTWAGIEHKVRIVYFEDEENEE